MALLTDTASMELRIRNIPEDLHFKFKALCSLEHKKLNDKIIEIMRDAVEKAGLNKMTRKGL